MLTLRRSHPFQLLQTVIFVPQYSRHEHVRIFTYSVGDQSWKTHAFSCPNGSSYSVESVVYMDDSFYCFSGEGLLSSFSVATREW